jgi:arylsulfatase A
MLIYEGGIRVPMLLRWPDGLEGHRDIPDMVHFSDWFPTLLAMADIPLPRHLEIDGIDVLPVIRGENGTGCTKRFWQWNRYTPVATCNAAVRDGDWKLVRPAIREAMTAPCSNPWLNISMYTPEKLIEGGLVRGPDPRGPVPDPPPPELYNIATDPLEKTNLADQYPERVRKLLAELETWFEEVEQERATIDDVW